MQLIIDGKNAVLKENFSFDYVTENRSFSDADDYTLSITLPLAGCPENLDIFGHVDRMDVDTRQIVLDAIISDRSFSKKGIITIVEATDVEIKCQFLEGRSVQNFLATFDDIYINEMNLGIYPASTLPPFVSHGDIDHGSYCVALPWWNESAEVMNNEVVVVDGVYQWADSTKDIGKLSYMPYLIEIARQICRQLYFTYDFSQWEKSAERFLLVCNALPASWDMPRFARALPHWSVTEFFSELEKILACEIDIDHKARHISLAFSKDDDRYTRTVKIDNVLDAFSSEVSYEDELCRFKGIANLRYADRGDEKWKYEQCQWLVDLLKTDGKYFIEFDTEVEYRNWCTSQFGLLGPWVSGKESERGQSVGSLIHIIETDRYGMWRVIPPNSAEYPNMYQYEWLDINRFGDVINNPDSDNDIELQMIPACIQYTDADHGKCLFLSPSGFDGSEEYDDDGIRQPATYSKFLKGEPDAGAEYYDKILLAYWDGNSANENPFNPESLSPPCPEVDKRFSLMNRYAGYLSDLKVNPKEKMKISWLGSSIPDIHAIFHIKGKRYLCERITATFTEDGLSQLLKGEFYPIIDES